MPSRKSSSRVKSPEARPRRVAGGATSDRGAATDTKAKKAAAAAKGVGSPGARSGKTSGRRGAGIHTADGGARSRATDMAGTDLAKLERKISQLEVKLRLANLRIADLEADSDTDPLLGILNRRGFLRELNRAIAYVGRYAGSAIVTYCDVDCLKPINDGYGHAAGDAVLRAVTKVLLAVTRASDVVGRLGGDEFAILLWNLSQAEAEAKAAGLQEAVAAVRVPFGDHQIRVGVSLGLTCITAGDKAEQVLDRADRAMYGRKHMKLPAR